MHWIALDLLSVSSVKNSEKSWFISQFVILDHILN